MSNLAGITFDEVAPRSVAAIGAYRDRAALLATLEGELGVAAPTTPSFVESNGVRLTCLAPSRYLAGGAREAALPGRLSAALGGRAAVTDQSDLWHVFSLEGPSAADALSRLVPVDLHAAAFPVGAVALTRAGHLNVRVWHVGEGAYEIAVARSYADDLRHALSLLR